MAHFSFLVMAKPQAGREAEWEAWHRRHVEDVLKVPGFVSCRRFCAAEFQPPGAEPRWSFAVLYELQTDDVEASIAELRRRAGTDVMPMSSASDPGKTVSIVLKQLSEHSRKVEE
jgi:hypothetical protein